MLPSREAADPALLGPSSKLLRHQLQLSRTPPESQLPEALSELQRHQLRLSSILSLKVRPAHGASKGQKGLQWLPPLPFVSLVLGEGVASCSYFLCFLNVPFCSFSSLTPVYPIPYIKFSLLK